MYLAAFQFEQLCEELDAFLDDFHRRYGLFITRLLTPRVTRESIHNINDGHALLNRTHVSILIEVLNIHFGDKHQIHF